MNSVVLGALIGASPALLAGVLTAWVAMRSAQASREQAELALRADHERWLREKRSDLYVEMIRFLREVSQSQVTLIQKGKLTDEQRLQILEAAGRFGASRLFADLAIRGTAIASSQASGAFVNAAKAGQIV